MPACRRGRSDGVADPSERLGPRQRALQFRSMSGPIRFQAPTFPPSEAIERYFELARAARWFTNFGPCDELLRSRLTEATGRPCVLVANATLGLIVAIAALRGRAPAGATEVLVPSFAFAASAQCAVWNGLDPVFVDVAPDHWHLDPDALSLALDERRGRVAAVVALSSLGVPPPPAVRKRWESACAEAGVPLVVDSAAGFGARAADGVLVGAQGDAEVVSFHALKPLSAGEGGAVFCRDEELAAEVTSLINFSFDPRHQVQRPDALNAKLSELAAAVGLASLDELPRTIELRRALATELGRRLPDGFDLQRGHELGTWQFFPTLGPDPRRGVPCSPRRSGAGSLCARTTTRYTRCRPSPTSRRPTSSKPPASSASGC